VSTYCPALAADVPSTHRCPACTLAGDLSRANDDISTLRRELARVNAALTNARAALYNESEAHAITNRKLENALGRKRDRHPAKVDPFQVDQCAQYGCGPFAAGRCTYCKAAS
jgi:hypothetical protein